MAALAMILRRRNGHGASERLLLGSGNVTAVNWRLMNIGALPRRRRPQVTLTGTKVSSILEAPYLGGLTGAWPHLGSSACQAKDSQELWAFFEVLGPPDSRALSRSPHRRRLGHIRGPRTAGISETFEDVAPPEPRALSAFSYRRNLGNCRGPRTRTRTQTALPESRRPSRSSDTAGISDTAHVRRPSEGHL